LKSATLDALKAFEAFASPRKMLAQGSVGPGDILYTPLGWFFVSRNQTRSLPEPAMPSPCHEYVQ
jgi:hypothetical protein